MSWNDIEEYISCVVSDLNKRGIKPTGVYGPPRGGLIFATLLSYKMDIPLLLNAAKGCVIIDDIADSGRTLLHFTENDTPIQQILHNNNVLSRKKCCEARLFYALKKR